MSGSTEDQVAVRGDTRFVARLAPRKIEARTDSSAATPVRLEIAKRGALDQLVLRPVLQPEPGAGQVVIRVQAAGLNFRDVLNTLGMYPGDAGGLGQECAGTIIAVGAGVSALSVGDSVMAMAYDSLGTFAMAKAALTVRMPSRLSFIEAATLPITFATAEYALNHLAHLKAGDRVLIHAAAGGVGLAAVQVCMRAGATVFATAGSPAKRDFLRSLGVQHVYDSRTLDFADQILSDTDGTGVDVVLNSLTGAAIPRSLDVLATGGRFLEIGKRDILDPQQVAALGRAIDYHIIYLGDVAEREPDLVGRILQDIAAAVAAEVLAPLPLRAFALADAAEAFRYMAQARHIGKVVLTPNAPAAKASSTFPCRHSCLRQECLRDLPRDRRTGWHWAHGCGVADRARCAPHRAGGPARAFNCRGPIHRSHAQHGSTGRC